LRHQGARPSSCQRDEGRDVSDRRTAMPVYPIRPRHESTSGGAGAAELVDASDSHSRERKLVRVRADAAT